MFRIRQTWTYGLLLAVLCFALGTQMLSSGREREFSLKQDERASDEKQKAGRTALKDWNKERVHDEWCNARAISEGKTLCGLTKQQVIEHLGTPYNGRFACEKDRSGWPQKPHESHLGQNEIAYNVSGSWHWAYLFVRFNNDDVVVSTEMHECLQ